MCRKVGECMGLRVACLQFKNRGTDESFYIMKHGHAGKRVLNENDKGGEIRGLEGSVVEISQNFSEKLFEKGLISVTTYCIM